MSEEKKQKTFLGRAFDAVKGEAVEVGRDVQRDAGQLTREFAKYGKNRLVSGGAVALKMALLGSVVPVLGTKVGAVGGFVVGFLGGPPVARSLERIFGANSDEEKPETEIDNDHDDPDPPPPPPAPPVP